MNINSSDRGSIEDLFKKMNQAIWIVTTQDQNRRAGLTATWIHQASVDVENPTFLAGLAPNHFTCELLQGSGVCVLHLLELDQIELALRFAKPSSRNHDKFANCEIDQFEVNSPNPQSVPYLSRCHTAIACQVIHSFNAGDRIYFLMSPISCLATNSTPFLRESDFFSACTLEQKKALKQDLLDDVRRQQPLLESWISEIESGKK